MPEHLSQGEAEDHDSLTRLDLSSSRLPTTSSGLGVILERNNAGATAEGGEEPLGGDSEDDRAVLDLQAAGAKDHSEFLVYTGGR